VQWGNNAYACNTAFVALLRARQLPPGNAVSACARSAPLWSHAPLGFGKLELAAQQCRLGVSHTVARPCTASLHLLHPPHLQTRVAAYRMAKTQIDYMMGGAGRSYIVGWGLNPPLRVSHLAGQQPPEGLAAGLALRQQSASLVVGLCKQDTFAFSLCSAWAAG
jgi:hypothetical protein